jgi:hypothetical protein
VLALHQRAGELELRGALLCHVGAIVGQVGGAPIFGDLPVRQFAVGETVLADVGRVALAVHRNRLERADAVGATQSGGGIVDEPALRRRLRAGGREHESGEQNGNGVNARHGASYVGTLLSLWGAS